MPYAARVLADSIPAANPEFGKRLITVEWTFPRYLLAEVNTHRQFSRNSASSRAIPPEKHLMRIIDDPFVPVDFYGRATGMSQDRPLEGEALEAARKHWLRARHEAVRQALILMTTPATVREAENEFGYSREALVWVVEAVVHAVQQGEVPPHWLNVSKSTVNRLLEPFMWHTAIITATDWENFFALRCPVGDEVDIEFPAEPELQRSVIVLRQVMRESEPQLVEDGWWHLPLVREDEGGDNRTKEDWCLVSAGRCATVTYEKPEAEYESAQDAIARAMRLGDAGHMSPFEHQARPWTGRDNYTHKSNLRGWVQYRKLIPYEDNRVGHLENRPGWEKA